MIEKLTSIISIHMSTTLHVWRLLMLKGCFSSSLDLFNLCLCCHQWLLGLTKKTLFTYLILSLVSKKVMLQIGYLLGSHSNWEESKQNRYKPSRRLHQRSCYLSHAKTLLLFHFSYGNFKKQPAYSENCSLL